MIKKLTVEAVNQKEQISKRTNKPFTSLSILSEGVWYSGFAGGPQINKGDVIEVEVSTKDVNGTTYHNWQWPKDTPSPQTTNQRAGGGGEMIIELRNKHYQLEERVARLEKNLGVSAETIEQEDDLPF